MGLNLCGKIMKVVIYDIIKDGVCLEKGEKLSLHDNYDEPGMYEEFRPIWGPGSSYKPWING